jgi:multiple sugar transport system permease protein
MMRVDFFRPHHVVIQIWGDGVRWLKDGFKQYGFAYLLILPAVIYLLIFQVYPLVESIRLSFTNTHLVRKNTGKYIGLDNYKYLFTQDDRFWGIVANSFYWILVSLVFQFLVALIVALILDKKLVGRSIWRGFAMVPWMMPVVVVGLIWKWMFDYHHGLVNFYLKNLGIIQESINWFGDSKWVWPSLFLAATWKGFGYLTVMILAGLQSIPPEVHEAGKVDGTSGFKHLWYITLPLLKPVLFVSGIVQIITGWTKFEMIWVLTNGGPGWATSILPTYIYTNAFEFFRLGRASAIAVISTLIVAAFIVVYYRLLRQAEAN